MEDINPQAFDRPSKADAVATRQMSRRLDIDVGQVSRSSEAASDENNYERCPGSQISSIPKFGMDTVPESRSLDIICTDVSGAEVSSKDKEEIFVEPRVGVEFESEEHAYKSYSRYAVLGGFSIRKDFVNKSRINGAVVSRRYICYRQGYRPDTQMVNARSRPRQETRTGCLAHMTISRQPNGKFRVTHLKTNHNHEFVPSCTARMLLSQKRLMFSQAVEEAELASNGSGVEVVPKLGMGFESDDHAYEFYNAYAGQVGFSVRKDYVNRSKIDGAVASRRFTCFREGFRQKDKRDLNVKRPRKETRIGCLAQLVISRQPDGKYRVTHFEERHNHELVTPCKVHMLRSQKRLSSIHQVIKGNAVGPSELSCHLGRDSVSLEYDPIDHVSKLSFKRTQEMKAGQAERILQYFQTKKFKNPSFFYKIQVDAEDQITNVLWTDTNMVVNFNDFGDVVCFDTTYRLSKDKCHPFSPFFGLNHHRQMVVFGAVFLYDDTVDSFKWAFQTFLEAMSGKKPKTLLTDSDEIIAEAVSTVFPESDHRVCVWQMYQKALAHLGHMFVGSDSFITNLSSCFLDHGEEEEFLKAWKVLVDVYGLWENQCLKEIFEEREKWSVAYKRHVFSADIRSVLLCDGFVTNLKKCLNSNSDVISFLKNFTKVVTNWRYKELEAS